VAEFVADVRLIWKNAFEYNPENVCEESTEVRSQAAVCQKVFDAAIAKNSSQEPQAVKVEVPSKVSPPPAPPPAPAAAANNAPARSRSRSRAAASPEPPHQKPAEEKKTVTPNAQEGKKTVEKKTVTPNAQEGKKTVEKKTVTPNAQEEKKSVTPKSLPAGVPPLPTAPKSGPTSEKRQPAKPAKRKRTELLPPTVDVSGIVACSSGVRHVAAAYSSQGKMVSKIVNQDTAFLNSVCGHLSAGVFDGHGPLGEVASELSRDFVSAGMEIGIMRSCSSNQEVQLEELTKEVLATANSKVRRVGEREQIEMARRLKGSVLDYGTCATVLTLHGTRLMVASIGDCRCIVVKKQAPPANASPGQGQPKRGAVFTELTVDHRAENPAHDKESQRVEAEGGAVFMAQDRVYRVKAPDMNNGVPHKGPGTLQLTRSMGHATFHKYGVSAEPDVKTINDFVGGEPTAVVVASDGVWDVFSNAEVARMVAAHVFAESSSTSVEEAVANACKEIVTKGLAKPNSYDDTTCLVVLSLSHGQGDEAHPGTPPMSPQQGAEAALSRPK